MSGIDLPGPVVYTPETPAHPDDPYGGMTPNVMLDIVAEIDPEAAIIAAFAVRRLQAANASRTSRLFLDDPAVACCAGALSTLAHRLSPEHVAHVRGGDLAETIADEIVLRRRTGDTDEGLTLVPGEIMAQIESRCAEILGDLSDLATATDSDLLWTVPFYAMDVPDKRITAYERAELTWSEALTFEMYGPPESTTALAALALSAPVLRLEDHASKKSSKGHLRLV